MQTVLSLCSDALGYAIHKQFHLVGIIVIAPKIHFLTQIPVPMREKMQNRLISPFGLI
jgi:hypothetical protein